MEPLARLQAGVDQAEDVIGRIDRGQYDLSTPCHEWNVGELVNHMIGALVMFRDVAEHGECDPAIFGQDLIGDDATKSLVTAGHEAIAGWSAPGKIDGMAKLPFGEMPARFALQLPSMDMLVHSWDLAKATGLDVDWNQALVSDVKAFSEENLAEPELRGDDFAPPVQVGEAADDLSALVAFLGRTP